MSNNLRIVWVGFHSEGLLALRALVKSGRCPVAVITLDRESRAKRCAAIDPSQLTLPEKTKVYEVRNINDSPTQHLLRTLNPDLLLVVGWSQILKPEVLAIPKLGTIGAHASLLPHNRGSAPINWALIRGEKQTGNSLIWLREHVDTGDIINQQSFPITDFDTCASLYERVAQSNAVMILDAVERLERGEHLGRPQGQCTDQILPRRRPSDGAVDWQQPARSVYDHIRALTRPYPGAFSFLAGQCVKLWQAALLPIDYDLNCAGLNIGPVVSPVEGACGQVVACGKGAVVLLEVEFPGHRLLSGRELAMEKWTGVNWQDAA